MRNGQCDICSKMIVPGQSCIAFRIKDDERLIWCIACAEKNKDDKVYPDGNWEPHIYGQTLWWD